MPVNIGINIAPAGSGCMNFVGSLRVNFTEMNVSDRLFTLMVSKMPSPEGLYVAVFRDGSLLFTIDSTVRPMIVCVEEKYGRGVVSVIVCLSKAVERTIKILEEAAVKDTFVLDTGVKLLFSFPNINEGMQEVIYLMCRAREKAVRI